jgi:precorrin-6B methylase 2
MKKTKKTYDDKIIKPSEFEDITLKKTNCFWRIIDRLAGASSVIENFYEKTVGREYKKEIDKFDLKKSKKILHIGCGTYPITALSLSELKDIKIVTIDHDEKSIKTARKIIKQKKLEKKISADAGDGIKYPLNTFDTIIISGCSVPKIQVLNHVLQSSQKKSKIIIREEYYKDKIKKIIDATEGIEIIGKMDNHAFITCRWESICVLKK